MGNSATIRRSWAKDRESWGCADALLALPEPVAEGTGGGGFDGAAGGGTEFWFLWRGGRAGRAGAFGLSERLGRASEVVLTTSLVGLALFSALSPEDDVALDQSAFMMVMEGGWWGRCTG